MPSIVQYSILKTLCLSIKNNKLLFHNSVHSAIHCTLTTRIMWTLRNTALLTRVHSTPSSNTSELCSRLTSEICDTHQQHQTKLDPPPRPAPPTNLHGQLDGLGHGVLYNRYHTYRTTTYRTPCLGYLTPIEPRLLLL